MPTTVFTNVHDRRYRFMLEWSARATVIIQLDPPNDPVVWLPNLWGQWNGQRTQANASRLTSRLTTEPPSSAWFRRTVLWIYPPLSIDG